jgi:hypothetical protein
MLGGWTGNLIISEGSNPSDVCTETWVINSQTDGGTVAVPTRWFSGTFQRSGSAVTCAGSGTLTGIMTENGTIAAIVPSTSMGVNVGCTLVSGTRLGGVYRSSTLTAQSTETLNCGGTMTQRTLTLAMHRQ